MTTAELRRCRELVTIAIVRKRILVVEDDDGLRGLYRTTLTLAGYLVEEASDGLVALSVIDNRPPDLVVLDLMLPTVSGFVVQQDIAARSRTRDIPVVIVTSQRLTDADRDALAPRVAAIVAKDAVSAGRGAFDRVLGRLGLAVREVGRG